MKSFKCHAHFEEGSPHAEQYIAARLGTKIIIERALAPARVGRPAWLARPNGCVSKQTAGAAVSPSPRFIFCPPCPCCVITRPVTRFARAALSRCDNAPRGLLFDDE
jgi:hypothetical protein